MTPGDRVRAVLRGRPVAEHLDAPRSAMAGMAARSGPWDPKETPFPPFQSITADRWRRLPLMRISVWFGARLRSIAGRTRVAASLIGCMFTANDGTRVRSRS